MSVLAIIPARGSSKRLARKNLLPVAGLPLVSHSIAHARAAGSVDDVVVSTDDDEIAAVAEAAGAEVVRRPDELATDGASSESALLHVLDERRLAGLEDPELVVFLQCTSPVRHRDDVDGAVRTLLDGGFDSVLSVCPTHRLLWELGGGEAQPVNWDHRRRLREQDRSPQFVENGSIYVFRPEVLRRDNNRLGGRIGIYEMGYWSSFQIDSPEDAALVEWILKRPGYAPPIAWPERIELVVFDFDGVMTDNRVVVNDTGNEAVMCNRSDGWGIGQMHAAGVPMIVLSTEPNPVVAARCAKQRLDCHQNVADKRAYLAEYLEAKGIDPAHVIFVGNDANDIDCMELVGLPVAVADSEPVTIAAAKVVLSRRGGHGAVRELCDLVLEQVALQSAS